MRMKAMIGGMAMLALAGCASMGAGPAPRESATLLTATATVESVDMATREVALRTPEGELLNITAGPEVRNLAQVEPGDQVEFDYFESVVVSMADSADPVASAAVVAGRAPEGDRPGAMAAVATDFVVEFVSYNPNTAQATFITPNGETRRVTVQPQFRQFAETRRTGDRINIALTEAVAVMINETAS